MRWIDEEKKERKTELDMMNSIDLID